MKHPSSGRPWIVDHDRHRAWSVVKLNFSSISSCIFFPNVHWHCAPLRMNTALAYIAYLTWPHQQPFRTNTVLVHHILPDHINNIFGQILYLYIVSYLTTSTAFSDKYCTCTSYLTWPHQQPFRTNTELVHRNLPDHINSLFGQILYLYIVTYLTTSTAFSDKYCTCTSYLTWPHQ